MSESDLIQHQTMIATWVGAIGAIIVTAVGAVAATWIVHKQNKLIERQTQIDLFEKRYEIYELANMMLDTFQRGSMPAEEYFQKSFYLFNLKAGLLFEKEDVDFLRQLQEGMWEAHELDRGMRESEDQNEKNQIATETSVILRWLRHRPAEFHLRFSKYVDFSKFHQPGPHVPVHDPRMD